MNLRSIAVDAYQRKVARAQQHIQNYAAERERKIISYLSDLGVSGAEVVDRVVLVDDLQLRATFSEGYISGWEILGTCPICNKKEWSFCNWSNSVEGIGKLISEPFRPAHHECVSQKQETTESRLANLIRDIVRDEVEDCLSQRKQY